MSQVFFFFQAEDGIRDADVTGVQTCALPISSAIHTPWGSCSSGGLFPRQRFFGLLRHMRPQRNTGFHRRTLDRFQSRSAWVHFFGVCSWACSAGRLPVARILATAICNSTKRPRPRPHLPSETKRKLGPQSLVPRPSRAYLPLVQFIGKSDLADHVR